MKPLSLDNLRTFVGIIELRCYSKGWRITWPRHNPPFQFANKKSSKKPTWQKTLRQKVGQRIKSQADGQMANDQAETHARH